MPVKAGALQEGIRALVILSTTFYVQQLLTFAHYSLSIWQRTLHNKPLIPPWESNTPHNCLHYSVKHPSVEKLTCSPTRGTSTNVCLPLPSLL